MSNTHTHPHTRHMWEAKMTAGCAVLSVFSSCSLLRNGTKEHTIHIPYLAKHSFTAPNGWAGLHSTSTTSFAGIILADFQTLQLGGHAIAHRSGAEPGGTDSALDLYSSKLTALAVLRRSSYLVLSGGLKIGLVERSPHRAPAARARRRAGVGARREDRLNPLNRHLNERACLGRPAWLQPV